MGEIRIGVSWEMTDVKAITTEDTKSTEEENT